MTIIESDITTALVCPVCGTESVANVPRFVLQQVNCRRCGNVLHCDSVERQLPATLAEMGGEGSAALLAIARAAAEQVAAFHERGRLVEILSPRRIVILDSGQVLVLPRPCPVEPTERPWCFEHRKFIEESIAYLAPEQIDGSRKIGPAADIFALGGVFHFACTGKDPSSQPGVLESLLGEPIGRIIVTPGGVPDPLLGILINSMTHTDPENRLSGVRAILKLLTRS